jgi:hypothetical protein
MRLQTLAALTILTSACGQHVVSSGSTGTTGSTGSTGGPGVDGGQDAGPGPAGVYPAAPSEGYGLGKNRVVADYTVPGYLNPEGGVNVSTLTLNPNLNLQDVRNAGDAGYRYLLLDIAAGWCNPCNEEAADIGLGGANAAQIQKWASEGGLVMTVLEQGYDESTGAAPVQADLETWISSHDTQNSIAYDPTQTIEEDPTLANAATAFPANIVIDLQTMQVVAAWYGFDSTYSQWEAVLSQ